MTNQVSWVSKLWTALSSPLPDPGQNGLPTPQQTDEWALLEFARLRKELEEDEAAKRRAFIQGQVCARIADGHTRAVAARMSGVTPETLSRWCRSDPIFADNLRAAEAAGGQAERDHWRLKMTAGVQEALLGLLRSGASRKHAAAAVGVSRQTFYTWLNARPDFRQAVLSAETAAQTQLAQGR